MNGYYYLHENGDLIFKRDGPGVAQDLAGSNLVKAFWVVDTANRETAWHVLAGGLALGANPSRVHELAESWRCDDSDALVFATRIGVTLEERDGCWRASFQTPPSTPACGEGPSALEALADLHRQRRQPCGIRTAKAPAQKGEG